MREFHASGPGASLGVYSTPIPRSQVTVNPTTTTSPSGFTTSPRPSVLATSDSVRNTLKAPDNAFSVRSQMEDGDSTTLLSGNSTASTGRGILIGVLSAFGSAAVAAVILAILVFFRYTQRGRIMLDRFGRPGEYDDEQALAREEAEALEVMDDISRSEYLRAKAFVQANPPESMQTDISLSQFLAIQEKGVSAWEFQPELEIANCFVEARTEIEFFDSVCSVQTNLPVPKQNDVYYWEAKIFDKPENTLISIGMTTKPYPLFRLPGYHKTSIAYQSTGHRRYNRPFTPTPYGPPMMQGDVIGVGYRPRSGAIFFTRNGKKLDEVTHGLRSQNFFPTIGANGPCSVHVNFGQLGFVFIEGNVKKWGLAPTTGSLAPPPPYGSEQGSILLESGRESAAQISQRVYENAFNNRLNSTVTIPPPTSPDPTRSPTDISLAPLSHVPSNEDAGEGSSRANSREVDRDARVLSAEEIDKIPPPDYSSPESSQRSSEDGGSRRQGQPPIPTYEAAVGMHSGPAPRTDDENH